MSIGADLARIKGAKQSLRTVIEGKGIVVPTATRLDEYHSYVDAISGGGMSGNMLTLTPMSGTYSGVDVALDDAGVVTLNGTCQGDYSVPIWSARNLAYDAPAILIPGRRYVVMDASADGYEFFAERDNYQFGDMAVFDAQGGISATTGLETTSTSYVRTPMFPCDGQTVMCTNTQKLKYFAFLYDEDGNFIARYNDTSAKYLEFAHTGYARVIAHHENWATLTPNALDEWNPRISKQTNHNGRGLSYIMRSSGYYTYNTNAFVSNNQYCNSPLIPTDGETSIQVSSEHWIYNVLLYDVAGVYLGYVRSAFSLDPITINHTGHLRVNGRLATPGIAINTDNYMRNFDAVISKGWVSMAGGAVSVDKETDLNHMYIELQGEATYNNVRLLPGLYDLGAI